ncbi:thioredoxin domain-containing protein 16-like [Diadema antillarum]|uniref:thioredoxin domain-containing protein 16-like n=1 Tax=Diadema antillarum TaxID=105358 RepID=UPI003A866E45
MMDCKHMLPCFLLLMCICPLTLSEIYNLISSNDFDAIKASKEVVAISFIRSKPYDAQFQNHFRSSGEHLQDFGVLLGTVDCLVDPVTEYCTKPEAAENVLVFRHGTFILTLAYDTLYGVDAIVSNILHLVLIFDVPITSERSEFQDLLESQKGRRDVILGFVPAIGITADRAFTEVAFAYRHKFKFIVTTRKDLIADFDGRIPSLSRAPVSAVFVLQCSVAAPREPCAQARYHGPISTEGLVMLMKTLALPSVVDMTGNEEGDPFQEEGIAALYAVTDPANHKQALSIVMETATSFRGSLGLVVINRIDVNLPCRESSNYFFVFLSVYRDDVTYDILLMADTKCIPACFVLQGIKEHVIDEHIRDASELKNFVETNIHLAFSYHDNQAQAQEEGDNAYGGYDDEDQPPIQEQQDDHVQAATVHLRLALQPPESPIPSLTDVTFPSFTGKSQLTSVLFTMKWNPRSLAFLQSFESASQSIISMFPEESLDTPLARVECSSWPDVCDKSNVTVYPTVKMYKERSDIATYGGILDEGNFLKSYILHKLPNPVELQGAKDVDAFTMGVLPDPWVKDHLPGVVVAIIPDDHSRELSVYRQVAQELAGDFLLGLCTSKCAPEMLKIGGMDKPTPPSVIVEKWNDPNNPRASFEEEYTPEKLAAFIRRASMPILPELTAASMPTYMAEGKPFAILFNAGDDVSREAVQSLLKLAQGETRQHYVLCQMDSSNEGALGSKTLVSYGLLPTPDQAMVVILDREAGEVCSFPQGSYPRESSIKAWLLASLQGNRECSEYRALINREWMPLVPPYDYLKLMEEEEQVVRHGRRGLRQEEGPTPLAREDADDREESGIGDGPEDTMADVPPSKRDISHQHEEL